MIEYVVDGKRVSFIRQRANKVLDFLLDECATSFDDQKQILQLALADVNGRIRRREVRKQNGT